MTASDSRREAENAMEAAYRDDSECSWGRLLDAIPNGVLFRYFTERNNAGCLHAWRGAEPGDRCQCGATVWDGIPECSEGLDASAPDTVEDE